MLFLNSIQQQCLPMVMMMVEIPAEIPDNSEPSPINLVAVHVPTNSMCPSAVIVPPAPADPNSIPDLAVTTPIESTLVTSSYVKTPVNVQPPVILLTVISGASEIRFLRDEGSVTLPVRCPTES